MEDCGCPQIPVFYYDSLNSQARSCYMLIQILNIDVEIQEINFVQYESTDENYRGTNTLLTVPTLIDGNITLCHGPTIMMYLCEKYSCPMVRSLFPQDYISRVKIMSMFFYEGYYLHRYLGHLLADIFLSKYPNIDLDFHRMEVSKAYNTLNNFLKGHCFMINNCMTISDISAVSSVGTLNCIFPIDRELYPNLYEWLHRLKKMEFYQINDEGICKQRYFLEMVGKLPFPVPSKSTDTGENDVKNSSDASGTNDESENLDSKCESDDSVLEIDLKKVRRSTKNEAKTARYVCTCIPGNANKSGNAESAKNVNNRRVIKKTDNNDDNSGGGKQALGKRRNTVGQTPEDSLKKRASIKKAVDCNKKPKESRESKAMMTCCCSNKSYRACTCNNSKKDQMQRNEKDTSEEVIHIVVGKMKPKNKNDKMSTERNYNARRPSNTNPNKTEDFKYCACGGTEDQQYRCSCPSENSQSRQKKESSGVSTTMKYCDCDGTGIPDQTYHCSCQSKSEREYEENDTENDDQQNCENINDNDVIYNCECEQMSYNCRELHINCHCTPESLNQSSEEAVDPSSIESAQKDSEEGENQASANTEEDILTEEDTAACRGTLNTILECDESTCPKLQNIVSLNPEAVNQNEPPSKKASVRQRNPARSPGGCNRLQAGCNTQSINKTKFQNVSCHRVGEFEELRSMSSYETLTDDSEEVTEIIYHLNMKKDNQCKEKRSNSLNDKCNSVSKIPRLITLSKLN